MKLDYCAIGMRIKERRTKKEWSQEMLASTVGISNPHMSNIERGKTKVSLATLIDIANPLDTTLDALICDNLVKGKAVFDEEISRKETVKDGNRSQNAVKKTSELFMIW
mgnify:CR=1 FL=1